MSQRSIPTSHTIVVQNATPAMGAPAAGSHVSPKLPATAVTHVFPSLDTNVAMTITPASTGASASASSDNGSMRRFSSAKSPPSTSLDSLPDPSSAATTVSSSYPGPRSILSDHAFADRSPSPQTRSTGGAMAEAMSAGRNPGLIRRLSRGAQNKLRRRASTTHSMRMRDQSAGPLIVRRRSDSNGASDFMGDVSDFDLDSTAEDLDELPSPPPPVPALDRANALGIFPARTSSGSISRTTTFEGGIAPATSVLLENGTWVSKYTKRKMKRIKIWLDSNSARVCWHSTKTSKSFFIDDVREVRVGADSRNARDGVQIPPQQESRWVTIVYDVPARSNGRTIKTMHLVMPDDYILKDWTNALDQVTRQRIEMMNALSTSADKSEKSLLTAWRQCMARKDPAEDGHFTLDDARWLCRNLEINRTDHTIVTHYKAVGRSESAPLDYNQYRDFVHSFRDRKDIANIYRNLKFGTDLDMDLDTFLDFLRDEQMVDITKERAHWEAIFDKFAKPSQNRPMLPDAAHVADQRVMNARSFQSFLTSSYNAALLPIKSDPILDRPLNEYFISSSHNTYLLGRQFGGVSSVEGYIAALIKGCRCVEIDCWDGDDGRPRVTHGHSMSTKIPFEDCVAVIAKYAFNSSPYPLIISLEVHCSPEQQLAMVELMKVHFNTSMVTEPIIPGQTTLPSPEELRNRILIKVKAAEEPVQILSVADTANGRSRARSIGQAFGQASPAESPHGFRYSPIVSTPSTTSPADSNDLSTPRGSTTSVMTPSTSAEESDEAQAAARRAKKRRVGIIPELGRLGVYTQGIKFHGFQAPNAKTFNHIYSFNEDTFSKHSAKATDSKALLEKHNTRYLMRVYPAALRIDSSNFNPLQSWRRGVQMAALNWQTYDVHQQVNEAMFAAGVDRFGYVLKPEVLRHAKHLPIADTIPEAPGKKEKKGKKMIKFSVEVISAQRLPRPRNQSIGAGMNPYVEFEMFSADDKAPGPGNSEDEKADSSKDGSSGMNPPVRKRTRIIEGNGFDPQWRESITLQVQTKFPSLLFVRWTVWNSPGGRTNSNNVLLATFTAKLVNLQQGYRHLPLFNPQGEQYKDAKLFVRIRKEQPVPVEQVDNAYGIMHTQPHFSPKPEALRTTSSWKKYFKPRGNRKTDATSSSDPPETLSRTSSLERDRVR